MQSFFLVTNTADFVLWCRHITIKVFGGNCLYVILISLLYTKHARLLKTSMTFKVRLIANLPVHQKALEGRSDEKNTVNNSGFIFILNALSGPEHKWRPATFTDNYGKLCGSMP